MQTPDEARQSLAENLSHVIEIGSAAIEQESSRAERFGNMATSQATLAGTWFAASQAVAVIALTTHTARGWVIVVIVAAVLQTISLSFMLHATGRVWKLRSRHAVGEETLEGLSEKATLPPEEFANEVVALYRWILYHAQEANDRRAEAFEAEPGQSRWLAASSWWLPVLLFGFLEIVAAALSRAS